MRRISLLIIVTSFMLSCSSDKNGDVALPTPVKLLSPSNNNICEEGLPISDTVSEVLFLWESGENTDTYELRINNLITNQSKTKVVGGNRATEVLERGNFYIWTVVSLNSDNSIRVEPDEPWKFYLPSKGEENYAPFPANIISPEHNSDITINTGKVSLQWSGLDTDTEALLYKVYFGSNFETVSSRGIDPIETTASNLEVEVQKGEVYYWLVETTDYKNSSYTNVSIFSVK